MQASCTPQSATTCGRGSHPLWAGRPRPAKQPSLSFSSLRSRVREGLARDVEDPGGSLPHPAGPFLDCCGLTQLCLLAERERDAMACWAHPPRRGGAPFACIESGVGAAALHNPLQPLGKPRTHCGRDVPVPRNNHPFPSRPYAPAWGRSARRSGVREGLAQEHGTHGTDGTYRSDGDARTAPHRSRSRPRSRSPLPLGPSSPLQAAPSPFGPPRAPLHDA